MSAVSYTFLAAQNPAPEALPEGTVLPEGYAGTSTDEHLLGIFEDLAARGVSLANIPLTVTLPRPMGAEAANFYAQSDRLSLLLQESGFDDAAALIMQEGAWWDFEDHLPLNDDDAAGNYLLRLMLRFGETFESMVPALCTIIDLEKDFPNISTLERFDRLMVESAEEDGFVIKIPRAWRLSQAWEYAEVRKLLASPMDVEYGLQLAELGAESFEEVEYLSKRMPKHWVASLLEELPDKG